MATDNVGAAAALIGEIHTLSESFRNLRSAFDEFGAASRGWVGTATQHFSLLNASLKQTQQNLGLVATKTGAAAREAEKTKSAFERMQDSVKTMGEFSAKRGASFMGAGKTAAGWSGLGGFPAEMLKGETDFTTIQTLRGLTDAEVATAKNRLSEIAVATNQQREALIPAYDTLLARNLDSDTALRMLATGGRVATAQKIDVGEVANAMATLGQRLKIAPEMVGESYGMMASTARSGGVNLASINKYVPQLAAKAEAVGMRGSEGAAQLGAFFKAANYASGGDSERANQIVGQLLDALAMPDVRAALKAQKIDVEHLAATGQDLVGPIMELFQRNPPAPPGSNTHPGARLLDSVPIKDLSRSLAPLQEQLDLYQRTWTTTLANPPRADTGFDRAMADSENQIKKFHVSMREMARPYAEKMLERVNGWLTTLNEHPIWRRTLLGGIVGLLGVGGAMVGVGKVAGVLAPVIGGAGKVAKAGSEFRSAYRASRAVPATGTVLDLYTNFGTTPIPNPAETAKLTRAGKVGAWASARSNRWTARHSRMRESVEGYFTEKTHAGRAYVGTAGTVSDKRKAAGAELFRWAIPKKKRVRDTSGLLSGMSEMGGEVSKLPTAESLRSTTKAMDGLTAASKRSRIANLVNAVSTKIVTAAVWLWNSALFANPMLWVALVAVGAALLIFKFWRPITAFFQGMGVGIRKAMAPLKPHIQEMKNAFAPIVNAIKVLFGWLWKLIKPVEGSTQAASTMGEKFGAVIGGILKWLVLLPVKFLTLGANIVVALAQGIKSMATEPVKYIKEIGAKIMDFFPRSPAKEGPLRSLHKLKWGETIAMGIQPGPTVAAMRRVAGATLAAATVSAAQAPTFPLPRVAPGVRVDATGRAARDERAIELAVHVHLAPGTSGDVADQARRGALAASPELVRLIERTINERDHRRARTTFQPVG